MFAAPLYPLAKAQAYRALPDQSDMVNAVGSAFIPLDLLTPLFLGFVADQFGLVITLLRGHCQSQRHERPKRLVP